MEREICGRQINAKVASVISILAIHPEKNGDTPLSSCAVVRESRITYPLRQEQRVDHVVSQDQLLRPKIFRPDLDLPCCLNYTLANLQSPCLSFRCFVLVLWSTEEWGYHTKTGALNAKVPISRQLVTRTCRRVSHSLPPSELLQRALRLESHTDYSSSVTVLVLYRLFVCGCRRRK